jgi:hypothetical protein
LARGCDQLLGSLFPASIGRQQQNGVKDNNIVEKRKKKKENQKFVNKPS